MQNCLLVADIGRCRRCCRSHCAGWYTSHRQRTAEYYRYPAPYKTLRKILGRIHTYKKKIKRLQDIGHFVGPTDYPVSAFWWTMPWDSKPEWNLCFNMHMVGSSDSPWSGTPDDLLVGTMMGRFLLPTYIFKQRRDAGHWLWNQGILLKVCLLNQLSNWDPDKNPKWALQLLYWKP